MIDVTIIVVSYNTCDLTLDCLRSIYMQTQGITYELIVVDNASTDGSAKAIATQFPNLKLIASETNLGFAQANNLAATEASGAYLMLLNPDTVVLDGAIQKLYAFAVANPQKKIYGGRTLYGDLSLNPTSCWRKSSLWSLFCYAIGLTSIFKKNALFDPESYGAWQRDSTREVDVVTGCLLLIEKKIWDQLAGFDPNFFMYGEDADLCFRAVKFGARPVITPDATVIHYCGASEKVRSDKMIRLLKAKGQLIKRHWKPLPARIGIILLKIAVWNRMSTFKILSFIWIKKFGPQQFSWQEILEKRREWKV